MSDQNERLVPIFRSRREFYKGGNAVACTRTQFALTVAYAITVHKAQGMTLDQVVLSLAERDFAAGLTYVAISRVKTLNGILFDEPFDHQRLKTKPSNSTRMRQADYERRRVQQL